MADAPAASLLSARSLERLPPCSEDAEKGVLGSLLLDADRVMSLCQEAQIDPESFYTLPHRLVYQAALDLVGRSAIDALTITERLRAGGALDQIGGPTYIDRLIDSTPTAAHAEYYIDIVRQKHLLRSIIESARQAERECHESGDGADNVLSRVEQRFLDITERQHGRMVPWRDAVKQTMEHIETIFSGASTLGGIATGFHNLDHVALGLRPSEMIVLAARPSMGKTSLAMNIAENIALGRERRGDGMPVGIFSLEMSQEALVMRMLCSHAEVSLHDLLKGFAPKTAHQRLAQAASALGKAAIYVDDAGGLDILELRARARRMHKKFGVGVFMIDYLQLLASKEAVQYGRQNEVANISGQLKAMAKELKVPVLVLSQLSRAPDQRDKTGRPRLSDLRDSGAIEQDADMVWLLRRPCKYEGDEDHGDEALAIVEVAKQRNGPTGEVQLNFEDKFTRFRDRARGVDDVGREQGEASDEALEP